ncbi:MAG: hypothetical protein QNK37_11365 [Acidobacteriota bacterium]|nr:hypothetical protein [Acidobacteriota bacterium]
MIHRSEAPIPRGELIEACVPADSDLLPIDFVDVLTLLEASGLVRTYGTPRSDDPVHVKPVTGILNLPHESSSPSTQDYRQILLDDLFLLISRLHASSADFFRPGSGGSGKQLVPEPVFSAFLAMGLEFMGWQSDREAQQVSGRTDIKLRRPGMNGLGIIEVKIWGRNDYRDIHKQVESYWSQDTKAAVAITLTDKEIKDWKSRYVTACLANIKAKQLPEHFPLAGSFECDTAVGERGSAIIDHLLLRLPRDH